MAAEHCHSSLLQRQTIVGEGQRWDMDPGGFDLNFEFKVSSMVVFSSSAKLRHCSSFAMTKMLSGEAICVYFNTHTSSMKFHTRLQTACLTLLFPHLVASLWPSDLFVPSLRPQDSRVGGGRGFRVSG